MAAVTEGLPAISMIFSVLTLIMAMESVLTACAVRLTVVPTEQVSLLWELKAIQTAMNTIWDLKGNIKWQFEYPKDENGNPMNQIKIPPYVQEHMHLVYAISTGNYVNEAEQTAISTLTAIMGRTAAYTGRADNMG